MRRLWFGVIVAVLVSMSVDRVAQACAGCSNPNLPTARTGVARLRPAELSIDLNLTGTTMHVVHSEYCPDIGPICNRRQEPPQLHDQRFYVAELRAIAAMGITDVLGAELQLPFRIVNTTIQFRRLDGTPFTPDYENVHHRDETLAGFTDPWLLGRAAATFGAFDVSARAGMGLPVGSTEEDPFARGRAGRAHQHIQFGTGTVYPVFAIDAGHLIGRVRLSGYAQALVFLYRNEHGYQAGNRYSSGLSADVEIVRNLRVGVGSDVLNEQPERWHGIIQQDGNVGRTDLLLGGMLSYSFGPVSASLSFRSPVWQHFIQSSHQNADPGQLTYPAIVNLSLQTTFGGSPKPKAGAADVLASR